MKRKFIPFDQETIVEELRSIESEHRAKLFYAIERYSKGGDDVDPAMIRSYGDGIFMIRHRQKEYQGRVLFHVTKSEPDYQELTILTAYKKETQDVPAKVLKTAKKRMK